MSRIFISHSSRDNLESIAFRDWLLSVGYAADDVFLDLHSLEAGDRWRNALRAANRRCEAVILLASPTSLASEEVRREIILAEEYNKPILVALLDGLTLGDDTDTRLTPYRDRQLVDLAAEPRDVTRTVEHGQERRSIHYNSAALNKIRTRLTELGLGASSFAWKPGDLDTANPYPGLRGYTEAEAALFFGRDPEIAQGLAKLRSLRATGDGRLLVIQAASGAGKSSFLKAGLWPRLRRDRDFEPIAMLRPAGGIISGVHGLARALAARLGEAGLADQSPAELARTLVGDPASALAKLQQALSTIAERETAANNISTDTTVEPTLVIGIDQAEELFAAMDVKESRIFMTLLARLAVAGPVRPIFVLTLRDDSIPALLRASENAELPPFEVLPLPPIPRESFIQVIREPARVARAAGLDIDIGADLAQRMIEQSRGRDALPLLSVMLEQLVEDHRIGRKITLTLAAFEEQGGVAGALAARLTAARRLAATMLPEAGDDSALRRLMVPALATWDPESDPPGAKRLVAVESRLLGDDPAVRLLADRLVEKHLLVRSADSSGAATLEVAHEALLRQPPISAWLEADADFLAWLATIERARRLNEVNIGQLVFGAPREQVEYWLDARAEEISPINRTFVREALNEAEIRIQKELEEERKARALQAAQLQAAQEREAAEAARAQAASDREKAARRVARRTTVGLAVALVSLVGVGIAGTVAWNAKQEAVAAADTARQERDAAARARDLAIDSADKFLTDLAQRFRDSAAIPQAQLAEILKEGEAFLADMSAKIGDSRKLAMVESRLLLAFARITMDNDVESAARMVEQAAKRLDMVDVTSAEGRFIQAEMLVRRAEVHSAKGDEELSLGAASQALAVLDARDDASLAVTTLKGDAYLFKARALWQLSKHTEGLASAKVCIEMLTPRAGDDYFALRALWNCHRMASLTLHSGRQPTAAVVHGEAELALLNKAIQLYPDNVGARQSKVSLLTNFSIDDKSAGRHKEALGVLAEAQNELQKAQALAPWNKKIARIQSRVACLISENYRGINNFSEALQSAISAYKASRPLYEEDPALKDNLSGLLSSTWNFERSLAFLGVKSLDSRDLRTALEVMTFRIALLKKHYPPSHEKIEDLIGYVSALQRTAEVLERLGDFSRASDLMDEAAGWTDAGFKMTNPDWRYRFWSHSARQTANGCDPIKDAEGLATEEMVRLISRRIERRKAYLQLEPKDWMTHAGLHWCYLVRGQVHEQANMFIEAEQSYRLAAEAGYAEPIQTLEQWYTNGAGPIRPDAAKAAQYRSLPRIASEGFKRFTVPVLEPVSKTKKTIHMFLNNPDQIAPFNIFGADPVEAELYRIEKIQGYDVPQDVEDAFRKLLKNANDNNVDFKELLVYALAAGQEGDRLFSDIWQQDAPLDKWDLAESLRKTRLTAKDADFEPVREAFRQLREKGEPGRQRLAKLGSALLKDGDFALSELAWTAVLDDKNLQVEEISFALYSRGKARFGQKNLDGGGADMLQALALTGDDPLVLNYLAYEWLEADRNLVQAASLVARAVALSPEDGYILDTLGWAHVKQGRFVDAIAVFRESIARAAEMPDNHYHLAVALRQNGQRDDALRSLQAAAALDAKGDFKARIAQERVLLGCGADAAVELCQ